jgi:hypothetical protein
MCSIDTMAIAVCFNEDEEWVAKPIDFTEDEPVDLPEMILE